MSEAAVPAAPETCAQCSKTLTPDERVATGDRVFCRACYASLRAELEQAVSQMSIDVNLVNGTAGALLGAAVGALAWWGFTVLTHIGFGLIAVAIGFLAGWGAVRFTGGKRSTALAWIAVGASLLGYVAATYLVNMSFVNQALEKSGSVTRIGFPPQSFDLFTRVITADLGLMDAVFLAIAVWQAWKMARPFQLPPAHA